MPGRFSVEGVFRLVNKVTAPMRRMTNSISKGLRRVTAGVRRLNARLKSVGRTAGSALGVAGLAGALLAVRMAMGTVISKGAELEKTLVGAGARFSEPIDKGTAAFQELEDISRRLGRTTEFTANEAAGGLNFLAKAGFSAAKSLKLLPGLVDLATASELDLARTSDIASDALGAFGQHTEDATEFQRRFSVMSDRMSKTVNSSNVNMEELFETIRQGAPLATTAGVSMLDFLAFTAQIANAGLKASSAGTALKNIFVKLADVGVQNELKQMGVEVKDSAGEIRDFADIMDDLNASLSSKTKIERAGIVSALFGLRGITGVATVLNQGTDAFRAMRKEIEASEGATAILAQTMRDTLHGRIKTLNSAVESLTLTFFNANEGGINDMVTGLTTLVRAVDAFITRNPGISKAIAGLAVLGAVALVVGLGIAAIGAAVSFVAGSTTAMVVAGALMAGALLHWLDPIQRVRDAFSLLFDMYARFFALIGRIPAIRALGEFLGIAEPAGQVSSPAERRDLMSLERIIRSEATLRIEDPTGRAELTQSSEAPGINISLQSTGTF